MSEGKGDSAAAPGARDWSEKELAEYYAETLLARMKAPVEPLDWKEGATPSDGELWHDLTQWKLDVAGFTVQLYTGQWTEKGGGDRYSSLFVTDGAENIAGKAVHGDEPVIAQLADAVAAQLENPMQAKRRRAAAAIELL